MKFTWSKTGMAKNGDNKFSSPKRVLFTYEVETDASIHEFSRISKEEWEIVTIVENGITSVGTTSPVMAHKLLREIADGIRPDWTIQTIDVDGEGNPIGVKMFAKGDKITIRK